MDTKITELSQVFERFKAAFVRKDFDTCTKLLSQLKDSRVYLRYFKQHLIDSWIDNSNVKIEDQDAFERDFFQLKPYYTDARGRLPPSPQEYPILRPQPSQTPCTKPNSRIPYRVGVAFS